MTKLFLFLGILTALNTQAYAGPSVSGGGKGVVCRNAQGDVQSVELLDLWEARTIYRRQPLASDKSVVEQVEAAARALQISTSELYIGKPGSQERDPNALYNTIMENAQDFLTEGSVNVHRLRDTALLDSEDANEVARPEKCAVEQVVNYRLTLSNSDIYINQDLFEKMNSVNQAALITHEAVYKFLRIYGESNSVRVRRAVGMVFAGIAFPKFSEVVPADHVTCGANGNLDFFSQDGENIQALPVIVGDGSAVMSKPQIGYAPAKASIMFNGSPTNWKQLFTGDDNVCAGQPDTVSSHDAGMIALVMNHDSVDYDGEYLFYITCQAGKVSLRVAPQGARGWVNQPLAEMRELTCKVNQ